MSPAIPFYTHILIFIICGILTWFIFYALNYALNEIKAIQITRKKYFLFTALIISGWLAITAFIALNGTLLDFVSVPPKIILLIIPPVLAISYLSNSERVNKLIESIPVSWFVYIQSFRILLELMLWLLFISNVIPVQMTFEGLNYDVLTGLSAPLIGYYCLTINKWPRIAAVLWNIAGLLLVTNIFIVSVLSTPTPMRQFFNEPANTMIAYFPNVWIAAFIVPFAYFMHILSLKQIIKFGK